MRVSSIFSAPTRPALAATSYDDAKRICSMSRQSYGLIRKIAEVDRIVSADTQDRIFETHPEVGFAALYGHPLLSSKKTPEGRAERIQLLRTIFDDVDRLARHRQRHLHVDDVLDSMIAGIVAARRHFGRAHRLPKDPPVDSRGLRMEICY